MDNMDSKEFYNLNFTFNKTITLTNAQIANHSTVNKNIKLTNILTAIHVYKGNDTSSSSQSERNTIDGTVKYQISAWDACKKMARPVEQTGLGSML